MFPATPFYEFLEMQWHLNSGDASVNELSGVRIGKCCLVLLHCDQF